MLSLVLPFNRLDFPDPLPMPLFGEISGEPGADYLAHLIAGDRFTAQREDVGAVMLARVARHLD